MKILITGASGFLGLHLIRRLHPRHKLFAIALNHEVNPSISKPIVADLRDARLCEECLAGARPDVVVHTAALTQTGDCEQRPQLAQQCNVDITRNLLRASERCGSNPHFVFVSTDLVFDGEKGNYSEADEPNPLMVYGRTKLDAEHEVQQYVSDWAIVRSALIYGPTNGPRPSFLDWMLGNIRAGTGALFADEYRTPIYVGDLAEALERIAIGRWTGLVHAGGPERLSRYEFGKHVADVFGYPQENVHSALLSETHVQAPRPRDVSLNIGFLRSELGFEPLPPREALQHIRNI